MPFDGASVLTSNQRTLAIAMLVCGIDPIEPLVLDKHKADELARHPGFTDTELLP